ncbi:hypothetical protein [Maribellus sediminis]|uniref:hypothetical protein n=1 Tax=Maribellus sediminis TaxID=2696285 RepID=UPI0014307333|nr:hypothetical protein [Maribellus sediminis]
MNLPIQNEHFEKIAGWIIPKIDRYELVLTLLLLVTFVLRILSDIQVGVFITMILSTLALLYFLMAYLKPEKALRMELFLFKIGYWSLSVTIIGILFRIERWQYSDLFLIIGSTTAILVVLMVSLILVKKSELFLFNRKMKMRMVIIAALGLMFYITPTSELVRLKIMQPNHEEISLNSETSVH